MSHPSPFRQRPNLHLGLTHATGSPRNSTSGTPSGTPLPTTPLVAPEGTPFGIKSSSPLPSVTPKSQNYDDGGSPFPLLRHRRVRHRASWPSISHRISSRSILICIVALALTLWWFIGGRQELKDVKLSATGLRRDFFRERQMQNFRFYPATNPKIHVRPQNVLYCY